MIGSREPITTSNSHGQCISFSALLCSLLFCLLDSGHSELVILNLETVEKNVESQTTTFLVARTPQPPSPSRCFGHQPCSTTGLIALFRDVSGALCKSPKSAVKLFWVDRSPPHEGRILSGVDRKLNHQRYLECCPNVKQPALCRENYHHLSTFALKLKIGIEF